jgi:maleate cis-trans isomerase
MDRVAGYASDAGFDPVVHYGDPYDAADVVRIAPQEGVDLALELGRSALRAAPGADGLLLAGGSWFSMAAIPVLEAEFGKPVVTNPTATYWATMLQFGLSPSRRGCGRLLDSMPPDGRVTAR